MPPGRQTGMPGDPRAKKRVGLGVALVLLAFAAYVSLGLPDGLLGVAWPSIRRDFALPLDSIGFLFATVTLGYLLSSFFAGRLVARLRLGNLLALSTFFAGAALVAWSASPGWWLVVGLGVMAGLGAGGIDAALNIYVAANHGERAMQLLHASYGVGAMLGPVIMTLAITSLGSWRWGHLMVGGIQLLLAGCFALTVSLWDGGRKRRRGVISAPDAVVGGEARKSEAPTGEAPTGEGRRRRHEVPMMETLREWRVWLSMLLFFLYMGLEVTLGSWSFMLLTEARDVSPRPAGFFMAAYWGIFTFGRIVAGLCTPRVGMRAIVLTGLPVALAGAAVLALGIPGVLNLVACGIIALAIAPILGAFLSGTSTRVGERHTPNAIGIQLAAMGVGGATVPSLTGVIAEHLSLQAIPPFLMALMAVLIVAYVVSLKRKWVESIG